VAATRGGQRDRPEPDWAAVNRELKRKHVTLQVLWDEYIEVQPDGYRYSGSANCIAPVVSRVVV
jgi:transposase